MFYYLPLLITSLVITLFRLASKGLGYVFKPILWVFDRCFTLLERSYIRGLAKALQARTLVLAGVIIIAGLSALLLPKLGMELIPDMAQGEFYVEITLPSGSQLESTDAVINQLAKFTENLPAVARTYSLAGSGSLMNASASQGGEYWGKLNVVLNPNTDAASSLVVMDKMRGYLSQQAGVQSKFGQPALFTMATPLEIEISGYNLDELMANSQKL